MRTVVWVIALVGCGGSTPPPAPPPSNVAPPAPSTPPPATGLAKSVCQQRGDTFGPVTLTAEQAALRRGASAMKFADITTTKALPIEVCNPGGQMAWLRKVTCADGSLASSTNRSGNVGPGGLCDSIIDLYVAVCPEKPYEVYMDMYMCGPGESF